MIRMFRELGPYLRRHGVLLLFGFLFVVGKNLFQSSAPQIVKEAIDSLHKTPEGLWYYDHVIVWLLKAFDVSALTGFIIGFVGLEILHALFLYGMRQTLIVTSRRIEYDLRSRLFGHLQTLHLGYFQYTRTGDLMNRLNSDLGAVRDVLGPGIMYTANTIVSFFYVVPMMIAISPSLTLLAFLPLFFLSFLIQRLSHQIHVRSERVQEKLSDISSRVQENFSGIRIVKSFVREQHEIEQFQKLNDEYVALNLGLVKVRGLMMSSVMLTIGSSVAALLWMGGRLVIAQDVSLGEFTAFSFYLAILIWPIFALGWVINIFQRGSASMKRLMEILSIQPGIADRSGTKPLPAIRGQIEFRRLTFSYNGHEPVLRDLSLRLDAGTTLGIVGATGSGKTSLVHLIPRLFDAPEGSIHIDGTPIREIPLGQLRQAIGMVTQDTFLFSDTLYNNLVFGAPDADEEKAQWAADVAQLTETIREFPKGLQTIIGERGITLSGGQKQRLAIARAIVKDPNILILDDALSSVDTRTEEAILLRLKEVMKQRTSLIVSHRLQTLQYADHIIMLEQGRILEQGTHADMLRLGGAYARLHARRQLEEELSSI